MLAALRSGVSESKLAATLNLDVRTLRGKKNMLVGVCDEAINLLKDKIMSEHVFRVLKKMKTARQVKVAMIMNDQNRYSYVFAKSLLDGTPAELLAPGTKSKRLSPAVLEKHMRLEEENISLREDIQVLKESYGTDMLNLTGIQSYLKRMMRNAKVSDYLQRHHPDIHERFDEIVKKDLLKMNSES